MPDPAQHLSDLDLIGIASALTYAMGRRVMPADVMGLAVAPAMSTAFGTDEFVVAARADGKVFALSGLEDGWSTLDAEEVDCWIASIERDLDLLRNVRRAAFSAPEAAVTPKAAEDIQRWVSPVSGWHNDGPPTDSLLQVAVETIAEATRPQAFYLIGSLARGDARACRRSTFETNRMEPGTMAHSVARKGVLLYGADG